MIEPAPYIEDCGRLVSHAANLKFPAILVSCPGAGSCFNRYSVLAANPIGILRAQDAESDITFQSFHPGIPSGSFIDFSHAIRFPLSYFLPPGFANIPWPGTNLPFYGGWIGGLAYEFGKRFERMPLHPLENEMPALWFGLYYAAYIADHERKEGWYVLRELLGVSSEHLSHRLQFLRNCVENAANEEVATHHLHGARSLPSNDWTASWTPSLDANDYRSAANSILTYLQRGDIYQANLTVRYRRKFEGEPFDLFRSLLKTNPAPLSAFIQGGNFTLLSSSPELFLNLRNDGCMETRPIKGTIKRDSVENSPLDIDRAETLLKSPKNRAEHLMIVDLERNDLGRVCQPGSVHVDPLIALESVKGLHHLVSSVKGKLKHGLSAADAIAALFPGGSITGAPKIRAMEIIRELEPVPRGFYTGAIGWITPEGDARMNLAIRTMTLKDDQLDLQTGGGIVIDSDPDMEAEERSLKGAAMARAVEEITNGELRITNYEL